MKREKRRGQGNVEQEEPGRGTCTRERELLPEHTSTVLHTRRGERRTRTDAAVARKKSRRGQGRRLECQERIQRGIEREIERESMSEPGDATDGANVEKREEEELGENESAHCKRERRQREKDERSESRERA